MPFSPQEIEDARASGRLLTFGIELSRKCNLGCKYCYADAGVELPNELRTEEILSAITQAIELGARKVGIIGGGEPLLFRDLKVIIEYLHEKKVEQTLFTNGTLVTRDIAEILFKNDVNVSLKMNGMSALVQDNLSNAQGTHDSIQKGFRKLKDAGYPDSRHEIVIESVVCKQNLHELPDLWIWARENGVIPFFERLTYQGRARRYWAELHPSSFEIGALFEKLSSIDRQYGFYWEPQPPWTGKGCDRHYYNCLINSQGYIQPCSGVDLYVGNIRFNSLAEILRTSPVIRALRSVDKNIKGKCQRCTLRPKCYGCRGQAYQLTGDFLWPDPECWLQESNKSSDIQ